jgi:sialic acid synthase SpsE
MTHTYIIAEAGQNHNGDIKMARQLIDLAAMPILDKAFGRELPKVNAIKFTKRDLTEELTAELEDSPYDSPHSFGRTYGEHRKKLELSYEQHIELYHYAREKGLDFVDTLTSPKTLRLLDFIEPEYIKVASRDLTNFPLLQSIGETQIPVLLSTGMGGLREIDNAIEIIAKYHENITILHCISEYPADYENLNLFSIPFLKERYPYKIGYSDHSIGIIAPVVAVALGAEIIEKHITLSHALKGSDHKGALEPDGLWRMVRDIRNMEIALGEKNKTLSEAVKPYKEKLERSLCSNKQIKKGHVLTEEDLIMLSPGGGLSWEDKNQILGRPASRDIDFHSALKPEYFER